jgi:Aldehyde dehydrogenase family
MSVTTIDPSTGQSLASYEETTAEELNGLLDRAHLAAQGWRDTPPTERANGLRRLAVALRERQEELALLATADMGKPLLDSRATDGSCPTRACSNSSTFTKDSPSLRSLAASRRSAPICDVADSALSTASESRTATFEPCSSPVGGQVAEYRLRCVARPVWAVFDGPSGLRERHLLFPGSVTATWPGRAPRRRCRSGWRCWALALPWPRLATVGGRR